MAFINLKNNVILRKYDGTPTATDNITCEQVSINPSIAGGEIEQVSSSLGSFKTYVDTYQQTAEFDITLTARANQTDTRPECVELLKSSMIKSESFVPGEEASYNIDSVNTQESTTFHIYEDGEKYELSGGVSNININGQIGEPLKFTFNISRFVDQVVNEANPSTVEDTNKFYFVDKATGILEDGSEINVENFSLNMGNDIQSIYTTGVTKFSITDYKPELSLTMLKIKNDLTVWDDLKNQSIKDIEIVCKTQDTTPKYLYISIPFATLSNVEGGDISGLKSITKTYARENGGNPDANFYISYSDIDPLL